MTVDFTSTKTTSRRVVLLTGGARAGKSRRALEICAPYPTKIFCATATAMDDEMAARINAHQAERGAEWTTVEEPLELTDALIARADANAGAINDFATASGWLANLARDAATRSNTSVCLTITDPDVTALDADGQAAFAKGLVALLDKEGVAYDIGAYRDAPAGLRIWAAATVERSDLEALMPWLEWAFRSQKASLKAAA